MKKLFRIGLHALALAFALSLFGATETSAQVLNEVLKRMDDNNKRLTSLRTKVTYEKYDSVLRESEKMEGKAIYLPQKKKEALFRIDWTKPDESLAVVNKKYVLFRPKLKQAYTGIADKSTKGTAGVSSPLAFLNMSKAQLRANYTMKYISEETLSNGTKAWHLELTPKTAGNYQKAEIWVDGNGMPVQMKIFEKNKDTSSVLLSGYERNVTGLKGSDFQIDLPPGTNVIKK
jgi:outer membrane lipoprotein-sorting protein